MFCICCLDSSGPLVKITKCVHGDFMDMFPISEVDPPLVEVVCFDCHTLLKKIHQFKLQVQGSFSLLLKKAHNIEKNVLKMSNIGMTKVVHINIPEIPETLDNKTERDTKLKKIETALEIINSNCTSLQSLAVCNFKTLTETLIKAASDNFNLELGSINASAKNKKEPKEEAESYNTCATPVLPVKIKDEPGKEAVLCIQKVLPININDSSGMEVLPEKEVVNDDYDMTVFPDQKVEIKEEPKIEVVDEGICTKILFPGNTCSESESMNVLLKENGYQPTEEIEEDTNVDVAIHDVYGTAVLPAEIKDEPDEVSNDSKAISNLELNAISSGNSTHDNHVAKRSKKLRPSPPLIPIKLDKAELKAERQEKLESKEYRRWPHRCAHCIIGFQYRENLDDHNKRKHEMKKGCVTCDICRQVVLQEDSKHHKLRHYYRLECEKCKQKFVLFDEAYEHYKTVHCAGKNKRSVKRHDLKAYWRRNRAGGTQLGGDIYKVETITSTTSSPGPSLDFAEVLTRDVLTKINELHYNEFYFSLSSPF